MAVVARAGLAGSVAARRPGRIHASPGVRDLGRRTRSRSPSTRIERFAWQDVRPTRSEGTSILRKINFGANLVPPVQPESVDSRLWQHRAE